MVRLPWHGQRIKAQIYSFFLKISRNFVKNHKFDTTKPRQAPRLLPMSGKLRIFAVEISNFDMIREVLEQVISEDLADLWSVLSPDEKRLVMENFTLHHFRKNQVIYAEGDQPEMLWCLIKGKVKKSKEGIGGRSQILRLIRPVQYFGYRAYFAGEPYVSTATAFEQSTVGTLPLAIVEQLIRQNNSVAWFFIHELSHNLGNSDTKIVNLTQKHIRGRLAEALVLLIENYGYEDDSSTLRIYMSREDLANLSNMTTSNAIRTLTTFVNEKLIVVDGRRIRILNEAQLHRISKYG